MRAFLRGWLGVALLVSMGSVWAGAVPAKPAAVKPAVTPTGPATTPAKAATKPAPQGTLRVVNFDLQGRKGPLPVEEYNQLRALLVYLEPDVLALHNVQRPAADGVKKQLPKLALSTDRYYAFQPLTDTLGSALLSKYPISKATYLADASGAALGMQVTMKAKGQSFVVLVVRPPNTEIGRAAAEMVTTAVREDPSAQYVVLASFSPGTGVGSALSAWGKAGLADPGARLGKAGATYPCEKPKERLDFILLSRGLRDGAKYRVIRDRRLEKLSWHLPVEVTLAL
jgi:endonuclease/exonuclease/phosphatase family metal-dependent hydrolase